MRQKEPWGTIAVLIEALSTQRGQPPRMHRPVFWKYEQKSNPQSIERRELQPLVPGVGQQRSGVRLEQDPADTFRPGQ